MPLVAKSVGWGIDWITHEHGKDESISLSMEGSDRTPPPNAYQHFDAVEHVGTISPFIVSPWITSFSRSFRFVERARLPIRRPNLSLNDRGKPSPFGHANDLFRDKPALHLLGPFLTRDS